MFCTLCKKYNKTPFNRDTWTGSPCTRLRLESVVKHEYSSAHKDSVKLEAAERNSVGLNPSVPEDDLKKTFACLYHLCKRRVPHTVNLEPLLDLLQFLGLEIKENIRVAKNATYTSRDSIQDMLDSLSTVIEMRVISDVKNSDYFSLELDEAADVSVTEQLVMHGRYISDDGELKSAYLKTLPLLQSDYSNSNPANSFQHVSLNAQNIAQAVTQFIESNYLNYSKLCGIGTDGAPVLLGRRNGAVKKIIERQRAVQCEAAVKLPVQAVSVHCAGHRLNLACTQAASATPKVKLFFNIVRQLFDYFHNSPVRTAGLAAVQTLIAEDVLKMTEPSNTRWLSHGEVALRLKDIYPSVVLSLERECEERSDARAKGLHCYLIQYSFIGVLLMCCDILPVVNRLSKIFQQRNVDLSIVSTCVDSIVHKLQSLKDGGDNFESIDKFVSMCEEKRINISLQNAKENLDLKAVKAKYLSALIENIQNRFQESEVIRAFSIFNPAKVPLKQDFAFKDYGKQEILKLYGHFGLDSSVCEREWGDLKEFILDQHKKKTHSEFVKFLCTDTTYAILFPNVVKPAKCYRVIPLHSADCERDFSQMKLIKTCLCNRLNSSSLDSLMRIAVEGPEVQDFPFDEAVHHWMSKKNRRIKLKKSRI